MDKKTLILLTLAIVLVALHAVPYEINIQPVSVMTSYYDYMIGGMSNLPLQQIPAEYGGGYFFTYHGQRAAAGTRRVFYGRINADGTLAQNNEIGYANTREGYPSMDVDPVSGKPMYAWHSDSDAPLDTPLEVNVSWDYFLDDGISGVFSPPQIVIDNPLTITTPDLITTDNEFLWATLQIGVSPTPEMSRVYVLAKNAIAHTGNNLPSDNLLLAYADFDGDTLEQSDSLYWNYTSIPELDAWNVDQTTWRRAYLNMCIGTEGNVYLIGYHDATDIATETDIDEPKLDVWIGGNYGAGTWTRHTAENRIPFANLSWQNWDETHYLFEEANGSPVPDGELSWKMLDSTHNNAVLDASGKLHLPGVWEVCVGDILYPTYSAIRELVFDIGTQSFDINEIYPIAGTAGDNVWWQPWDTDGNGQIDSLNTAAEYPYLTTNWLFNYWDETAANDAMRFHFNKVQITEPNDRGWMACVWQDSRRSRLYNLYPEEYPEYAGYANVPEIRISVSPDNGISWSDPIVLNNQINNPLNGVKPMWVYPADKIEYLGTGENGTLRGRLYLLFLDDHTWGYSSMWTDYGGITYMAVDITFPGVGVEDANAVPQPVALAPNYPNPFHSTTTISYTLDKAARIELSVYNSKGQLVRTLVDDQLSKGNHQIEWDGRDKHGHKVAAGIYPFKISNGKFTTSRKMILLK